MKKLICIFALLIAANLVFAAQSSNITGNSNSILKTNTANSIAREVTGQGINRDQAIKNALYRAVEQVRGVRVDSETYDFGYRGTSAGFGTNAPGRRSIDIDSMNFNTTGTVYTTEIEGLIKSYEVLEEEKVDDETYQVKLKVDVFDYSSRGRTERVKVALMPVKTAQSSYRFLNQNISNQMLSSVFTQRLLMGLTQTNKFAVLDRESIADFVDEKQMLSLFDAPVSEQAKLAETLGADYLLVGNITQAFIEKIDKRLDAANFTVTEYKARFNFNYRLIDSSTKQVVLAMEDQEYLENDQVRELADEQNPEEWNSTQIRDAFLSIAANKIIEKIIEKVYPTRIAAILDDGQLVLNQGGDRMKDGMLLDVFTAGKEIVDFDTGESLGSVESPVALIEIQSVYNNLSYAKVIEGQTNKVTENLICRVREVKEPENTGSGSRSNITRTPSGGVLLPVDR